MQCDLGILPTKESENWSKWPIFFHTEETQSRTPIKIREGNEDTQARNDLFKKHL